MKKYHLYSLLFKDAKEDILKINANSTVHAIGFLSIDAANTRTKKRARPETTEEQPARKMARYTSSSTASSNRYTIFGNTQEASNTMITGSNSEKISEINVQQQKSSIQRNVRYYTVY